MRVNKRAKAADVSNKVRQEVLERDKWCIICGSPHNKTIAHYKSRAKGGLGIPQNLVVLCVKCHHDYDNGKMRNHYGILIKSYLEGKYGVLPNLIYKKGM